MAFVLVVEASGAPEGHTLPPKELVVVFCTVAAPAVGGGREASDCKVRYIPFVPCLT